MCIAGLERASAVSRRASSRVLVGEVGAVFAVFVFESEGVEEKEEGRTLFMNVQRFLLGVLEGEGVSAVSFGFVISAASVSSLRDECRL